MSFVVMGRRAAGGAVVRRAGPLDAAGAARIEDDWLSKLGERADFEVAVEPASDDPCWIVNVKRAMLDGVLGDLRQDNPHREVYAGKPEGEITCSGIVVGIYERPV